MEDCWSLFSHSDHALFETEYCLFFVFSLLSLLELPTGKRVHDGTVYVFKYFFVFFMLMCCQFCLYLVEKKEIIYNTC